MYRPADHCDGAPRFSPRRGAMSMALMMCMTAVGPSSASRADRLVLSGGDVIEGRVIAEESGLLRVAMLAGILEVPANAVTRRMRERSSLEDYEALSEARGQGVQGHVALARWCRDRGFLFAARSHALAAVRLEPAHTEARLLAGYVRLDGMWVDVSGPPSASSEDVRRIETLITGWRQRLRTLRESYLEVRVETPTRHFDIGRSQLLVIHSPLAVDAAVAVLADGSLRTRRLLIEFLSRIEGDATKLNLLLMVLMDEDGIVRAAAADALSRSSDDRVVGVLRTALRCRVDDIVRRAATALGRQGDMVAFDDLVSALSTGAFADQQQSLEDVLSEVVRTFSEPAQIPLDDRLVAVPPKPAWADLVRRVRRMETDARPPTSRFRSEVQDALIEITGQNFGFDETAWRAWRGEMRHSEAPR